MVHVELKARIPGHKAAEAYAILSDFSAYAACVDAVRSITVEKQDGLFLSNWEVNFHGGIMRWKEEDTFLPEHHAIQFKQIEGDVDYFMGEWRLVDEAGGCVITFECDFDLGLSGLSALLEPIADSALQENVRGIVSGLLGDVTFF